MPKPRKSDDLWADARPAARVGWSALPRCCNGLRKLVKQSAPRFARAVQYARVDRRAEVAEVTESPAYRAAPPGERPQAAGLLTRTWRRFGASALPTAHEAETDGGE